MLAFLKYAGLVVAACSTIWATTQELTTKVGDAKALTPAGYIALGITALGLLISVVSTYLADRSAARSREQQLAAELRRTRQIILASQPLTSLDLEWRFSGLGKGLRDEMERAAQRELEYRQDVQGRDVGSIEGQELNRVFVLFPFLLSFARWATSSKSPDDQEHPAQSVIALIALDDDRNGVLPIGILDQTVTWNRSGSEMLKDCANAMSGSISFCQGYFSRCEDRERYRGVTRPINNWPVIRLESAGDIVVSWHLDPHTLSNSLDRQSAATAPTARLASTVRIVLLFDIRDLPFDSPNLAETLAQSLWSQPVWDAAQPADAEPFESSLVLVANSVLESSYHYQLQRLVETSIAEDNYGEEIFDCRSVLLEYQRIVG